MGDHEQAGYPHLLVLWLRSARKRDGMRWDIERSAETRRSGRTDSIPRTSGRWQDDGFEQY